MDANERDATIRRRKWYRGDIQQELQLVYGPMTNAELGRLYRARILSEWAGCVTPEAVKMAGKGKALEVLRGMENAIEGDAQEWLDTCERNRERVMKRYQR